MSFMYGFLVISVAAFSFLTFYYWQQARSLTSVLKEGARRFNDLAQQRKQLKSEADSARKETQSITKQLTQAEKQLSIARKKIAEQDSQIDKSKLIRSEEIASYVNQNDHLKIQVETLTEQIKELEQKIFVKSAPKVQGPVVSQLEEKYRKTTDDYKSALQKLNNFEKQYKGITPEDYYNFKKRCSQFNRMYHGMRSLKEMAEQKTENFEIALLHLSKWVLGQTKGDPLKSDAAFGEVVGEALERTGGSFVDHTTKEAFAVSEGAHSAPEDS